MRTRLFILLLLVFLPVVSWANGDPVVRFSSVTRSGNPIPMKVADVRIVHEQLTFKPGIPYTIVEVRYTLQNLSGKAIHNLDYGFPIDFEGPADSFTFRGDEITESLYETGWRKEFLQDIAFSLDGKPLEWHSANEIVEKEHQEPAFEPEEDDDPEDIWYINVPRLSRMWTYTQLNIAPGATVDLEVRYSVYHEQTAGYYDFRQSPLSRFFTGDGRVTYDLTPAKHWGDGKAGSIDILLDASRLPKGAEYRIEGLDFVVKDFQWTFHADSFDYAKAPEISLRFGVRPPRKGEPFPAWADIESFRLPASAYKMTLTETTIDIAFPNPVPVTDISFFNGNPNDPDAWTREARADEYKLEIQHGDGIWETREEPFGEVYPYHLFEAYQREETAGDRQFLCVTDVMRQEGNRLVPVNEHEWTWKPGYDNRIRHIRLTVTKLTQRKPTGQNPLSGIRVYAYPRSFDYSSTVFKSYKSEELGIRIIEEASVSRETIVNGYNIKYVIRDNDELAGYENGEYRFRCREVVLNIAQGESDHQFTITRDLFEEWVNKDDMPKLTVQSFSYTGIDDAGNPHFETMLCIPDTDEAYLFDLSYQNDEPIIKQIPIQWEE